MFSNPTVVPHYSPTKIETIGVPIQALCTNSKPFYAKYFLKPAVKSDIFLWYNHTLWHKAQSSFNLLVYVTLPQYWLFWDGLFSNIFAYVIFHIFLLQLYRTYLGCIPVEPKSLHFCDRFFALCKNVDF